MDPDMIDHARERNPDRHSADSTEIAAPTHLLSVAITAGGRRLRALGLSVCALALAAGLAFGDPGIRVTYVGGVTRIELEGSYPQSRYTVYRATSPEGAPSAITSLDLLCLGSCVVDDPDAQPGSTYWYSFRLILADGSVARFGPYPVTVSSAAVKRVDARVEPNPFRTSGSVELFVLGRQDEAPVPARADIHDPQGRRVRSLFRGALPRGLTRIPWDGRDDSGRALAPGSYFLRLTTPLGSRAVRILRTV
jgi:hypothetical protein